jgi:hypothetical protein
MFLASASVRGCPSRRRRLRDSSCDFRLGRRGACRADQICERRQAYGSLAHGHRRFRESDGWMVRFRKQDLQKDRGWRAVRGIERNWGCSDWRRRQSQPSCSRRSWIVRRHDARRPSSRRHGSTYSRSCVDRHTFSSAAEEERRSGYCLDRFGNRTALNPILRKGP